MCIAERMGDITQRSVADAIWSELSAIESDGHWILRAGVITPDHLHLLVRLGSHLSLSRVIARLKAKTNEPLHTLGAKWQPNFYEHRLRADDPVEDVVRYIFLNPYRAGLVRDEDKYQWFKLGVDEEQWFVPTADAGSPFPEWLR